MSVGTSYSYDFVADAQAEAINKARNAAHAAKAGGGSTLMQLAAVLGAIADKFVEKVLDKAKEMDAASGTGGNENQLTAEMQALTQIMKSFTEAMNTVIKEMGSGNAAVARKG